MDGTKSYILQGLLNYLNMPNSGALLISGSWGCGKTHYIKNECFKMIKEKLGLVPVMVSLYGLNDLNDLPKRVLTEFLDVQSKEHVGETIHFGKIVEWGVKAVDACPKIKEWIDVTKIIGEGTALYSTLPSNVVLFFDDLERAIGSIDINDILGAINELVENRHFKVIVIANKGFIDKKQQSPGVNSIAKQEEIFYEKVIEKNLVFLPDIKSIYLKLLEEINDVRFKELMMKEEFVSVICPSLDSSNIQKERMQNIRTLKFALNHFHCIFEGLMEIIDNSHPIFEKMLYNHWLFLYGISIELKRNALSLGNCQGLSTFNPIANFNIDYGLGDEQDVDFSDQPIDEELEYQSEIKDIEGFNTRFFNLYYKRFGADYIFHEHIYRFVIGGIDIDYNELCKCSTAKMILFEPTGTEGQVVLDKFLKGFWQFKNEEVVENLKIILSAVEEGNLRDAASIYNASVYLFRFKELIGIQEEELKAKFTMGIEKFFSSKSITPMDRTNLAMLPIDHRASPCEDVYLGMLSAIESRLLEVMEADKQSLIYLFKTDSEQFMLQLIPNNRITPAFLDTPVLHVIGLDVIHERLPEMQPYDIINLDSVVRNRFEHLREKIKEELDFYKNLRDVAMTCKDAQTMSGFVIKEYLINNLNKILK